MLWELSYEKRKRFLNYHQNHSASRFDAIHFDLSLKRLRCTHISLQGSVLGLYSIEFRTAIVIFTGWILTKNT